MTTGFNGNGNGNGFDPALLALGGRYGVPAPPPVEGLTPAVLQEMVKQASNAMEDLRIRMEADYRWWRLEWNDDRWDGGPPDDYSTYVSNDPWTFANRIIAILSSARVLARVPYGSQDEAQRDNGRAKEKFFTGAVNMANDLLRRRLQPLLQPTLAWQAAIRGWVAGRALLLKREDDSTYVDITPFDPLHTYYESGPDGLVWLCHVQRQSVRDIERQYGLDEGLLSQNPSDNERTVEVYDFYDSENNAIMADGVWLKPPEPHGAEEVPCFVLPVGAQPYVDRKDMGGDETAAQGESVYAGNRAVYDMWNKTMSDRLTLVRRSLKPVLVYQSPEGNKGLERDPWQEGAEVRIAQGDKLVPLNPVEMSKETDVLLAHVGGEMQRASLPHTIYGQLSHPLSGYAINTLSQGLDLVVHERVEALVGAYSRMGEILCRQYATGAYMPIVAQGALGNSYFRALVDPQQVAMADDLVIRFFPRLPKDDQGAYQLAQIAREGTTPLLSDRTIMDDLLGIQDVDAEEDLKLEQMAERMSPLALLQTLITAMTKRGRMDLAAAYAADLQALLQQRMMGAPPGGGPGGAGSRGSAPSGAPPGPGGPGGGPPTPGPMTRAGQEPQAPGL
ncbi:MAG: hypothetical protein Q8R28_18115 [Dehalococcoidia bacterium]|nr:hypothetical protein [Dehalococcoidia bacterium]